MMFPRLALGAALVVGALTAGAGSVYAQAPIQVRLEGEAQVRLAEGLAAPGLFGLSGGLNTLYESYLIVDPVLTAGAEWRPGPARFGVGIEGLFPHPLAGETRVWPTAWAEVDTGWFGFGLRGGWGLIRWPDNGTTAFEGQTTTGLSVWLGVPGWKVAQGTVTLTPRLTAGTRGFYDPSGVVGKANFTAYAGLGMNASF